LAVVVVVVVVIVVVVARIVGQNGSVVVSMMAVARDGNDYFV